LSFAQDPTAFDLQKNMQGYEKLQGYKKHAWQDAKKLSNTQ